MFARQQFSVIRSLIRNSTSNYVLNYVIRHTKFCERIIKIEVERSRRGLVGSLLAY